MACLARRVNMRDDPPADLEVFEAVQALYDGFKRGEDAVLCAAVRAAET